MKKFVNPKFSEQSENMRVARGQRERLTERRNDRNKKHILHELQEQEVLEDVEDWDNY